MPTVKLAPLPLPGGGSIVLYVKGIIVGQTHVERKPFVVVVDLFGKHTIHLTGGLFFLVMFLGRDIYTTPQPSLLGL